MSNTKRFISAMMAVLMVLSAFSCLFTTNVFAAFNQHTALTESNNGNVVWTGYRETDADWSAVTSSNFSSFNSTYQTGSQVRSYEELSEEYADKDGFMYIGLDVYEQAGEDDEADFEDADGNSWVLTDHYVQPEQELLLVYYVKTSGGLIDNFTMDEFFTRSFFDVNDYANNPYGMTKAPTIAKTQAQWQNADDPVAANKDYASMVDLRKLGFANEDNTIVEDDDGPETEISLLGYYAGHRYRANLMYGTVSGTTKPTGDTVTSTTVSGVTYYVTSKAGTQATLHANNINLWDGHQYSLSVANTDHDGVACTSDDYFFYCYVAVRGTSTIGKTGSSSNTVPDGAIGQMGMDYRDYESNGDTNAETYFTLRDGTLTEQTCDSDIIVDTKDTNHVFMIGEPSESGGEEESTYTATFYDGSAQYSQTADLADGATVTFPADPTKTGATFLGWATSADSTTTVTSATIDGADANFYAVWGYSLKFVNGVTGATISESTVAAGAAVNYPTAPAVTGYTFGSWSSTIATMPAAATEITANYDINNYTITYQKEDGSTLTTATYAYGATVADQAGPDVEGETFTEWTYTPALENGKMPASNVIATPNFSTESYTITYQNEDGSALTTATYACGATVGTQAGPSKEGYTFTEWTYSPALTNGTKMPASDVTATPNFTINSYALTVDANGGTGAAASADVEYGTDLATYLGTPSKEGYEFAGWTYSPAVADGKMPASAVTATANYTVKSYIVTYILNNGEASYTKDFEFGATVTTDAPEYAGYDFGGWSYSPALTDGTKMPASAVTATATWNAKTINLTFVVDGATSNASQTFGENVTFPTVTAPTGKTFTGWRASDGTEYAVGATVAVPTADETYTAILVGNKHTLTFYVDGTSYSSAEVNYGATITAPDYTAAEGYELSAWADADGNALTATTTMPDNDTAFYATTSKKSYTLTFDYDNGDAKVVSTVLYNDEISYPTDPEKTGYTFAGWDSSATNMPANNLTITAIWTKNQYTLTIDAAGGTCTTATGPVYYGDVVNIADPTRDGYDFTGWTYSPELGSGDTMPATAVTATAGWKVHTHTLVYMIRTGEDGTYKQTGATATYNYGDTVTVDALPEKTGYKYNETLEAWADASGNAITGSFTMGDADVVLYATAYIQTYTDTWLDYDGNLAYTTTEVYGATITVPEVPGKEGYTGLVWDPTPSTQKAENMTFQVVGTAGKVGYTVTIYEQSVEGDENYSVVDTITGRTATTGTSVTATVADCSRDGFTLNEDLSTTTDTVRADGTTNLELYFDRNTYDLTVIDGESTTTTPVYYGATIVVPEAAGMTGYEFTSWKWTKTASSSNTSAYTTMPAEALTITAGYKICSYTINYVVDGAAYGTADTVEFKAAIPAKAYSAPEGYKFSGWTYTDAAGNAYTGTTMPAGNLTATGTNAIQSYTITFIVDGATYETITQDYGTTVTAPENPSVQGKTFLTWSPSVPTTMPAKNTTCTAQFQTDSHYAIFVDGEKQLAKIAYKFGDTIADIAAPTKTGYTFTGWDKELGTMGEADITFTAQWSANDVAVTFYAVDGDATAFATDTAKFAATVAAPETDPTRTSYIFKGWKVQGTSNSAIVSFPYTVNAESLTFVGVWEQDTSSVLVESVERITTGYYDKGVADYKITLKENVSAEYVIIDCGYKTLEFNKGTFETEGTEVSSIKSITTVDGKEVWVVEAILPAAEDVYTAHIINSEMVEEENALSFDVAYDTKPADVVTTEFSSYGLYTDETCATAATQVIKGEYLCWKFETSADVTWIKLVGTYTAEDGTTKTLTTLYKYNSTSSNLTYTKDEANGTATWVIKMRFTYAVSDLKVEEAFAISYRVGTKTNYYAANEGAPVNVTIGLNNAVLNPVTVSYDPYTLIDVTGPTAAVTAGTRATVTIRTTTDCDKVRIGFGTKYATYQTTTKSNVSYTDADGIRTWTISYKFTTAGTNEYTVNARGTAWGATQTFTTVVE